MKRTTWLLATCAIGAVLAFQISARALLFAQPDTRTQDQCTPESKLAWYNEFRQNLKSDQPKAYELAKKYLACPGAAGEEQITNYLKNFVALYEKASQKGQISDLVYNKKDYPKAFQMGKQVLTEEPDNLKVLLDLSYAGYAAKSETYNADTLNYTKKAIQLIESGKAPESWAPYASKDEALGYLYNTIASLTVQKNPAEGLTALIKAAQFEGKIKQLPLTYAYIAGAYEAGPYAKLSADYKSKFEGKDESPESKLALENINQVVDRMIDGYARAVSLAGNDPKFQTNKTEWMQSLTTWYKFRHNQSDAGLTELIASVTSKPLPPEPTPLTTLPASSSANGNPTASGSPSPSPGATKPASASSSPTTTPAASPKPSTTPATANPSPSPKPTGTAKPSSTPTPSKPKTKRHH